MAIHTRWNLLISIIVLLITISNFGSVSWAYDFKFGKLIFSSDMNGDVYQLPDKTQVDYFVEELINNYNVILYEEKINQNPSFEKHKWFFSLYHDIGNSFNVDVYKQTPNCNGHVLLLFEPKSDHTQINLKYSTDVRSVVKAFTICGVKGYYKDIFSKNESKRQRLPFGIATGNKIFWNDTDRDANELATEIFNDDYNSFLYYLDSFRRDEILKLLDSYKKNNFNETLLWKDYADVQIGYYDNGTYVITNDDNVKLNYEINILKQVHEIEWKIENRKDYEVEDYLLDEEKLDATLYPAHIFKKNVEYIILFLLIIYCCLKKGKEFEETLNWLQKKYDTIKSKSIPSIIKKARKISRKVANTP